MTPDEKAIIDAKREGFVMARVEGYRYANGCNPNGFWVAKHTALAEQTFPYPPPPVVWREAVDGRGDRWRYADGTLQELGRSGNWITDASGWFTPDFIVALARCVTEPTMGDGENADA